MLQTAGSMNRGHLVVPLPMLMVCSGCGGHGTIPVHCYVLAWCFFCAVLLILTVGRYRKGRDARRTAGHDGAIVCRRCGHEGTPYARASLLTDAVFCCAMCESEDWVRAADALPEDRPPVDPLAPPRLRTAKRACPGCGAMHSVDRTFCTGCGHDID